MASNPPPERIHRRVGEALSSLFAGLYTGPLKRSVVVDLMQPCGVVLSCGPAFLLRKDRIIGGSEFCPS